METSIDIDSYGLLTELQYLLRMGRSNWIIGAGHFDENRTSTLSAVTTNIIDPFPPATGPGVSKVTPEDPRHTNAYLYSNIGFTPQFTLTAGLAYDAFKDFNFYDDRFNPKLGLIWESSEGTTVRAAWFKTLKRPFASEQTIEPTQIAGFNQFFDDLNGTRITRYGAALEKRIGSSLFVGAELSWRELKLGSAKQDEQFHRGYISWVMNSYIAFNGEYLYEDFEVDLESSSFLRNLKTRRVPLTLSLYYPNGLVAEITTNHVEQEVVTADDNAQDGDFWITDASVAHRFHGRRGTVRLTVKNLFKKNFNYQDVNFHTGEPLSPLFQPDRQVFLNVTLEF